MDGGRRGGNTGIHIRSTKAFFRINNTKIFGDSPSTRIFLNNAENGIVENCILENGGIYISAGGQLEIRNNVMTNSVIRLELTHNCTFQNNKITKGGFSFMFLTPEQWSTLIIDPSNTINEKPIYFYKDQNRVNVPEGGGQIILYNCTYFNIKNYKLTNTTSGIILVYSSHITLKNNLIYDCSNAGIDLWYSSENTISYNEILSSKTGIFFQHSDNNTIEHNKLHLNNRGIHLIHSNSNYIFANNASSNTGLGIECMSTSGHFVNQKNTIINNTVMNNRGIGLELWNSVGFEVIGNNILNNFIGISLTSANEGIFHHNNLINNTRQIENQERSENVWHDGKGEGNYWSNYQGIDADGNGVGDTDLPHQRVDYYPLMEPVDFEDYNKVKEEKESSIVEEIWFTNFLMILIILLITILVLVFVMRKSGKGSSDSDDQIDKDEVKKN
jgi:parallel beta-helix repeat protein